MPEPSSASLNHARRYDVLVDTGVTSFDAVVASLGLPREAAVADLGCGDAKSRTLAALARHFDSVTAVDRAPGRAQTAAEAIGPNVRPVNAHAQDWSPEAPLDLAVVQLDLSTSIDALLASFTEHLHAILKKDGLALVFAPIRTVVNNAPAVLSNTVRQRLDGFFDCNFGTREPALKVFAAALAAQGFRLEAVFPSNPAPPGRAGKPHVPPQPKQTTRRDDAHGAFYWLLLKPSRPKPGPRYLLPPGEAFDVGGTLDWLMGLKGAGLRFLMPPEFVQTVREWPSQTVSLLKHDIHHNLRRTLRLAEQEAKRGLFGVYFMLSEHALNAHYVENPATWEGLRAIRGLGHEIGYHVDAFDLVAKYDDLYVGLERTLAKFDAEGLPIRIANGHGNTAFKHTGLNMVDFFKETVRQDTAEDPKWAEQIGRYSYKEISEKFNIDYWMDTVARRRGERIYTPYYVTDNSGNMIVTGPDGAILARSERRRLDEAFIEQSMNLLLAETSLILLHPQQYE